MTDEVFNQQGEEAERPGHGIFSVSRPDGAPGSRR
jgi:hypothetical protein